MTVVRIGLVLVLFAAMALAGCISSDSPNDPEPIPTPEQLVHAELDAVPPLELGGGGVIVVEGPAFVAIPISAFQHLYLDHVQWTHADRSDGAVVVIMTPGDDLSHEPPECGAEPGAYVWSTKFEQEPSTYRSVSRGAHDLYIHVPEGEARFAFNHYPLDAEPIADVPMISVDHIYDVKARGPNRAEFPGIVPDPQNRYGFGLDHETVGPSLSLIALDATFSGYSTEAGYELVWAREAPECSVSDSLRFSTDQRETEVHEVLLAASPLPGRQTWDARVYTEGVVTGGSIDVSFLIVEARPGATQVPWW